MRTTTRQGVRNLDDLGRKPKTISNEEVSCQHKQRIKLVVRQERRGARVNTQCLTCGEIVGFEWMENWTEIQKLLAQDSHIPPVGSTIRQGEKNR